MKKGSLSRRITVSLVGYALAMTVAIAVHGFIVIESVERVVWTSLLNAEMDHLLARRAKDPGFAWVDTETLSLQRFPLDALPNSPFAALSPGLHDEVQFEGRELAVNVRDDGNERIVLILDISDVEQQERDLLWAMLISAILVIVVMALLVAWGARRLTRPLARLADDISALAPESSASKLALPAGASVELAVIANALNDYLQRNAQYLERERAFSENASHELRTPIAVIAGAAELAMAQPGVPAEATGQLQRIRHVARGVEQLISLLLVLAKSPDRLASMRDQVSLAELLPEIIEDHRHLCQDKELQLVLQPTADAGDPHDILAPILIVQAAIGNLLRNAIESSDTGDILVSLRPGPEVIIEDPGHGMSPEQISRLYGQLSRGKPRDGGGIGLALIARLCEHLGWSLAIEPREGRGTRVRLDLSASGMNQR
jgi:signal transduction histidine kinase